MTAKPTFSFNQAFGLPWRVMGRHPLALLVWGLISMIFAGLVASLVFGPMMTLPMAEMENSDAMPAEFIGAMMQVQAVSMLGNIGQLFLSILIWAATMRAALNIGRPERFFFLRVSMDELWLLIIGIALFVGSYIVMLILILLTVAVVAALWMASEIVAVLAGIFLGLALLVFLVVALARTSLIAPASLILKRLAFVEGWNLAKGQTAKLTGLLATTWLVYLVIYMAFVAIVLVALFSTGVFANMDWSQFDENPQTFTDIMPSAQTMLTWTAILILPMSYLYGAIMTLICAPFASAARQLMDSQPVAVAQTAPDTLPSTGAEI